MKIHNLISPRNHAYAYKEVENKSSKKSTSPEGLVSAAVNFVETKGKNTGMRFMQELNFNDINRHHKNEADRILNLSEGTALFLAFDHKAYKIDDPYVKNVGIRMAVSEKLKEENPESDIFWLESAGVAEPGSGFFATVPVFHTHGATIIAGFGFSAGTILRYRTSKAVVGDNHQYASLKTIPIDSDAARKMKAGQEFEISGQGKLRADANMGFRLGPDVGICTAGLGENIGPVTTVALEYGINVMSLNGFNKVRVTIRHVDQESIALVSNTALGLIIPANKLFPGNFGLPQFGHGLLKYFVEHKGPPNFEAYLTDYTSLTLNCSLTHARKHVHIRSYDLDLDNAQAAKAYNSLMHLDIRQAESLALTRDGVVKIELRETLNSNKAALRLALCTEKLFLKEVLKSESHGELTNALGQHKIYRDEAFKKHSENWFTSKQDALWESVNIKVDDKAAKTYYHFNYQKNDFLTRQREIDRFFKFADALGIKRAIESHNQLIDMHTYKKIFSSADDSKLDVDLYFTSAGVERIKSMSPEEMAQAYLETSAQLDDKLALHPLIRGDEELKRACQNIFDRYHMYRYTHPFIKRPKHIAGQALLKLSKEYRALCTRDLIGDYRALRKAAKFAELSQSLLAKEHDRHRIGKFFTSLGHSRISYTQGIATLTKVAGRENVLIHTLAASGGGVVLKSTDEGALVHPRNEMIKEIYRKV